MSDGMDGWIYRGSGSARSSGGTHPSRSMSMSMSDGAKFLALIDKCFPKNVPMGRSLIGATSKSPTSHAPTWGRWSTTTTTSCWLTASPRRRWSTALAQEPQGKLAPAPCKASALIAMWCTRPRWWRPGWRAWRRWRPMWAAVQLTGRPDWETMRNCSNMRGINVKLSWARTSGPSRLHPDLEDPGQRNPFQQCDENLHAVLQGAFFLSSEERNWQPLTLARILETIVSTLPALFSKLLRKWKSDLDQLTALYILLSNFDPVVLKLLIIGVHPYERACRAIKYKIWLAELYIYNIYVLGKPLSMSHHLYLGIAQIAITPPPPHSNGHPGALFFRRDFTILPFLPFFFTIFSE